jgi:hypothetical protein
MEASITGDFQLAGKQRKSIVFIAFTREERLLAGALFRSDSAESNTDFQLPKQPGFFAAQLSG